jgi:hypothetical protein
MKNKITLFFLIVISLTVKVYSHPFFVSITEVHIHSQEKKFDVSCSMFTEDLESAIKSIYITNTNLQKELEAKEVLDLIYKYITSHLQISIGGDKQVYSLVGCENIEESTWCYLEGDLRSSSKQITISNSLLFDFLDEQTNMVHVYWDEERQSSKLNNPNKLAEFSF